MTVSLKDIAQADELTANEIEPIAGNVKYAQCSDTEISPIMANVKYAQCIDEAVVTTAEAA